MNIKYYIPVYAITLVISAALLFSVQPMFSKMVLPLLGGTPQVWNTAMLFFQATLLAGYAYAHGTSRYLSIPVQASIHVALLLLCIVFLPLAIPEGWQPPTDSDPTLWQLGLMAACVGGPFFVIAGSAPMLQRWFSGTPHPDAHNPYFLYGASNLGSMTSLLSYPFIIDPLMGLSQQSLTWSIVYGGLIVFTIIAAFLVYRGGAYAKAKDSVVGKDAPDSGAPSIDWKLRLRWLFWAFVPSSMMLGVTTYITTDIASAPLLWILPLAIYVGSFILVFSRKQIFTNQLNTLLLFIALCLILLFSISLESFVGNPFIIVGLHFAFFFVAAVACHKRLADLRPDAAHLTEFYLLMSVGGVMGGFFNAIIAPQFFIDTIEYPIVIFLACFARYSWQEEQSLKNSWVRFRAALSKNTTKTLFTDSHFFAAFIIGAAIFINQFNSQLLNLLLGGIIILLLIDSYNKRWLSTFLIGFLILLFPPASAKLLENSTLLHQERNFFGVIRILDTESGVRMLLHGTTNHGVQAIDEDYKMTPISYYGAQSPIQDVMSIYNAQSGDQNIAVIGLGSGVTACYQKDRRRFDFFEIDPSIARIAQDPEYFTYLSDCGSPYSIILGDGRLTLQEKPDDQYDVLSLDAFSSDSIPVHLITSDAIELYRSKVKDDGVIIFHISNRHLDLEPVLALAAEELGMKAVGRVSAGSKVEGTELEYYPTHYVAFSSDPEKIATLKNEGWTDAHKVDGVKLWTDEYSNIMSVFGNDITKLRMKAEKEAVAAAKAEKDSEEPDADSDEGLSKK